MTRMVFEAKAAPEGVLEFADMQGMWLEGGLAMAPVWPYLLFAEQGAAGAVSSRSPPHLAS